MLPHRCKNVSFWRFRGDFICRLCHAGSTRAEGGPRRAFPPLIFVGRAASRPVGAACPAAGLPPVRRLYCLGRSLRAGRRRLILLMRASAAFCSFGGHKARSQSQSLASAPPQRIIRHHAALSDRPLGVGMVGAWLALGGLCPPLGGVWWVRGSLSAALPPWVVRGICKMMREKLQERGVAEAKRM